MANAKKQKLTLGFGVDVPEATRESRYQPLYDLLETQPGEWADVTAALEQLSQEAGTKAASPSSSAITLRKHGFSATTRQVDGEARVFAAYQVQEGEEGAE